MAWSSSKTTKLSIPTAAMSSKFTADPEKLSICLFCFALDLPEIEKTVQESPVCMEFAPPFTCCGLTFWFQNAGGKMVDFTFPQNAAIGGVDASQDWPVMAPTCL
jgi:hypothetical protein